MDQGRGPSSGALIGGIILLIVGTAFLLRNAGIIRVDWSLIWPAIVIAIGAVLIVGALRRRNRGPGAATAVVPVEGARRLELALRVGAGTYRLAGGGASLVEVSSNSDSIDSRVDRAGDVARIRLATAVGSWTNGWMSFGVEWRVAVATGIPMALDVQAGAGSFDMDLSDLAVTGATFSIGAADVRIVLPRPRGEVTLRVEGGAAQFTFEVPAGVEARVHTTGLLTVSGPTQSAGYASATDRVTVMVTGGVASVRVVPRT